MLPKGPVLHRDLHNLDVPDLPLPRPLHPACRLQHLDIQVFEHYEDDDHPLQFLSSGLQRSETGKQDSSSTFKKPEAGNRFYAIRNTSFSLFFLHKIGVHIEAPLQVWLSCCSVSWLSSSAATFLLLSSIFSRLRFFALVNILEVEKFYFV